MRNRPLCFLILIRAAFSVHAQDVTSTTADGDQLPEAERVVVSATKIETPINEIGSSVTVVTDEEIERNQRRTLPDVLETVPGLNVVQTGGPGGFTSVLMRGANSNHTKVVIDGIDANDPSEDGRFDFGQVLTGDLARVEILRGPQSGLYGSDALGGVINIVTKKGEGPPHFTGTLEGGSFDTFNQTAGASGSISRFNYSFNVAHFLVDDTPVTPLDLLPPGRKRIDDSYENTTLSTKLGADFTDAFGVDVVARYTDSTLFFTGDDFSVFPSVPAAKQSEQDVEQIFTRGQVHLDLFDGQFKNTLGLGYTNHRTKIQAPNLGFGLPPPTIDHGDRIKFDWLGNISIAKNHTLLLGVEDQNDRLLDSPISAENGNIAGFGELQSQVVHNLFAAASVRWDENERFGGEATWRIAPAYIVPVTETKLKASYGTGFKAPSLTQLFVSFPAFNFFANPNLQPEESEGYDLGFEQPLWQDHIRFGATYFHNEIKNLILPNATFTSLENIGRATTEGAEVFVELSLADQFKFRGDYTYTDAIDDTTGLELIRRPKHRASINVNWHPIDRLSLSATLLYVGTWVDGNRSFSIPRLNADSYYLVNVAAEYDAAKGVTLFARADNLFDRRYEDPVGFQRPGFGFFAGVRVAWDVKLPTSQSTQTNPEIYAKEKK
ncbi:MAG TPA: TonB-dependent receptor [Chthoniobacterales bacterium]|nr:TonB-dependent receptor [Chthoniobacterales bacterium]